MRTAADRPNISMSAVIFRDEAVTLASCQKLTKKSAGLLCMYATVWLHVAISAATAITAYTAHSTLRDVGIDAGCTWSVVVTTTR